MNAPRLVLPAVFLLALLAGLLAGVSPGPALAGDDPHARIAELEFELAVTRLRLDVWSQRTDHLYRLAEGLLEELEQARADVSPREAALAQQVEALRAALAAEQGRHVDDVARLDEDLRAAKRLRDRARREATAYQRRAAALEDAAETRRRDLERLQWHLHLAAPPASVRKALGYVSITHWQRELAEGDPTRVRVALSVLQYLPDRSDETVAVILGAVCREGTPLDYATGALVAIGEPAVLPLVELGRKKGGPPIAWVMHVLAEIGPAAKAAIPWLGGIAEDPKYGRDGDAARRAIEKISGS